MVKFVVWGDGYSVCVNAMDEHHHKFIDYLNDLYDAVREKKNLSDMKAVAQEFYDYTRFHFKSEEALLAQYNYPGLDEQEEEHAYYVNKIATFRNLLFQDPQEMSHDMLIFFKDWFLNHIQQVDKKYGPFLNERITLK